MSIDDSTRFVDDEVAADDAHIRLAIHGLLAPRTVSLGYCMVFVGQQDEVEVLLGAKLLQFLDRIGADPNDDRVVLTKSFGFITEPDSMFDSTTGIRFGVEVEDYFLAAIMRQLDFVPFVGRQSEIRGCFTALYSHWDDYLLSQMRIDTEMIIPQNTVLSIWDFLEFYKFRCLGYNL